MARPSHPAPRPATATTDPAPRRLPATRAPALAALLVAALAAALAAPAALAGDTKLLSESAADFDKFGTAVAASRGFVAVGSPFSDGDEFNTGSIHVWRRAPGGLVPDAVLQLAEPGINDYLGLSLDIDRDVLVAGSDSAKLGVPSVGAVHVFRRAGDAWQEEARLVPPALTTPAFFGLEVDVSGDLLLVGAPGLGVDVDDDGAAWIYRRVDGVWTEEAFLRPHDPQEEQYFGYAVQIRDGLAVVSALGDNGGAIGAGAVYVFERDGSGAWVETQKLLAPDMKNWDGLGESIALDGDWLAIGSPADDDKDTTAGSVYLYRLVDGAFVLQEELWAPDAQFAGRFGRAVAMHGDRLAVGALNAIATPGLAGAVYLFRWTGAGWRFDRKILPEGLLGAAELGADVDLFGDVLAAGAPLDDEAGSQTGAAYMVDLGRETGGATNAGGAQASGAGTAWGDGVR